MVQRIKKILCSAFVNWNSWNYTDLQEAVSHIQESASEKLHNLAEGATESKDYVKHVLSDSTHGLFSF